MFDFHMHSLGSFDGRADAAVMSTLSKLETLFFTDCEIGCFPDGENVKKS